jgi:hypothetical protein
MKYYSEDDETENGEDPKCQKEGDWTYNTFSNIYCISCLLVTTLSKYIKSHFMCRIL